MPRWRSIVFRKKEEENFYDYYDGSVPSEFLCRWSMSLDTQSFIKVIRKSSRMMTSLGGSYVMI